MAILYNVELSPGKIELVEEWLPKQPWANVEPGTKLSRVSSFRFDDPAGEVGVEFHLVKVADDDGATEGAGTIYQVPVTYRGAPLAGAEDDLITEMDHPVLGHRWVYDGAADPVCVLETLRAIVTGGRSVDEFFQTDSGLEQNTDVAEAWGTSEPNLTIADLPEGEEADRVQVKIDTVGDLTLAVFGEVKLGFLRVLSPVAVDALGAPTGQLQVKVGADEYVSARLLK
ncbi:hypothetical protein [Brevibacterium sp. HMSC24B04]|uniref:maltokinase N-terminal cap-like domain-containing protein n=1 Tax=Brevibacterium sp. HMSC24B04 TaxID=1581060 RepID=UPI0008A29322|nr:hypothetical protein [Brevibacterium sp. HMSC24B04]OFT94057.1 hypothetical protein HMPREF3092_04110 [Brevibacterium sp. HMSC24B04]